MSHADKLNNFVIKFANVNGSGSASANLLFAKSLFRMGLPVVPKNIFPSNIQGLPTWYEIRVSESGYLGRREGVDIMVAMNAQTYNQDLLEMVPGGYLLYDSTMPRKFPRDDIKVLEIPIAKMCAEVYSDARQRQLFKNVVYVGALAALMEIEVDTIQELFQQQFAKKPKLIEPNMQSIKMGYDYAKANFDCPLDVRVQRRELTKNKIMISGNDAAGLGSIFAGATVCAWYPITPSTSLAESFDKYMRKFRKSEDGRMKGAVVQAEDELSAIGMVLGASWNGARAFTATSGPGVSLMTEFLGLGYFAEIPAVLFNIQRGGPSTGMPTRTQQSDILSSAYASHGDTKHVLLFPSDPKECFEMAAEAFALAEKLQTPIIVMSDLDIGMNDWVVDELEWDDSQVMDRGKVLSRQDLDDLEIFGRYMDVDGDGIPYRTLPGTHPEKGAFFTRGSSHDPMAGYTEDGRINAKNLDRLIVKFKTAESLVPAPVLKKAKNPTRLGLINFGGTEASTQEALDFLEADNIHIDQLRLKAFPFNEDVRDFADTHDLIFVVEQNRDAQMRTLLMVEADIPAVKLHPVLDYEGMPITAEFVHTEIKRALEHYPQFGRPEDDKVPAE
ncbi:MAG: 2-oxoacid:acceptor oxidoreductase subunit alpha [Methyloligellaceae bacterium]